MEELELRYNRIYFIYLFHNHLVIVFGLNEREKERMRENEKHFFFIISFFIIFISSSFFKL